MFGTLSHPLCLASLPAHSHLAFKTQGTHPCTWTPLFPCLCNSWVHLLLRDLYPTAWYPIDLACQSPLWSAFIEHATSSKSWRGSRNQLILIQTSLTSAVPELCSTPSPVHNPFCLSPPFPMTSYREGDLRVFFGVVGGRLEMGKLRYSCKTPGTISLVCIFFGGLLTGLLELPRVHTETAKDS